ncbi:hypothetical protein TDB9533_00744 [Thalassocella blandensis]|nr:hypothetical protein TDB9533_00744 [Thalassocella blandensis]
MSSKKHHSKALRQFFYWARLLHIYVSTALFALLIFFCITGYFLNHLKTFGGQNEDGSIQIRLPEKIHQSLDDSSTTMNVTTLTQWLHQRYHLQAPRSIEFDRDMNELFVDYNLPAGYATAVVNLDDGELVLDYRRGNTLAIWNDLHKGRHSGKVWSWIIDLSALLMVFFALTGIAILFQHKKQRKTGVILVVLGALTPVVIYLVAVPRLQGV